MHELIHHSHADGSPYPSSECKMYHVYETHQPINIVDEVFWRKDGVAIPVEYWSHPVVKDSVVIGSIATFFDITERKRSEEQIEILSKIPSESPNPIMRASKGGSLIYANPSSAHLLTTWKTRIGRRLPVELRGKIKEVFNSGANQEVEVKCGEKVYSLILAPILDTGYVNLYGRDITQRKQAEEILQSRTDELSVLYQLSRALTEAKDLQSVIELVNRHAVKSVQTTFACIALLEGGDLVPRAAYPVRSLGHDFIIGGRQPITALPICQSVLDKNEPIILREGSLEISNIERATLMLDFAKSVCLVPLRVGDPLQYANQAIGLLILGEAREEKREPFTSEKIRLARSIGDQAAISIDNARLFDNLRRSKNELELAYDATIQGWSHALDFRDRDTEGHSQRVTEMTVKLAKAFGFSPAELVNVRWGALLHDIGKMGVPDGILLKPSSLTDMDWKIVKKHPTFAFEWLSPITYLKSTLDIPYCHHEKWDGTGYPRGLKGEAIPLPARIFAIVDVWDALTSDRPYRPAWTKKEAFKYIQEQSGKHFDPKVVSVFEGMIQKGNKEKSV
jgi:HD-GYP domain-containing protein (c-di-GMP phosphodiesterase class II)